MKNFSKINRALAAKKKFLLLAALFCATTMWALDPIPASGTIGTCDFTFDSTTGLLTITSSATAPEWGGEVEIDNPLHSPFAGQAALKEVVVEEGVIAVGTGAFLNCKNLEKITFSSTVGSIGFSSDPWQEPAQNYLPFLGCEGLKTLVMKSYYSPDYDNEINFNDPTNAFGFDPSKVNLYVYDGSAHNYIESGWGVFHVLSLPAVAAGTFGDGLTWKLSGDGKLTVTGVGAMPDYTEINQLPWIQYVEQIKEVVIGEGITHIGSGSFAMFANIEKAYFPATLTSIGANAFVLTSNLTEIICCAIVVPTLGENALSANDRWIYVWNYMRPEYEADNGWNVHTISAFNLETRYMDASVSALAEGAGENSLNISWQQVEGASQYVITLSATDGSYTIDITTDSKGHVTGYASHAPRRQRYVLNEEAEGWTLHIDGLEYGKTYDITVLAKDDTQTIATFHTSTTTITDGIENANANANANANKLIREGILYIERNGKTYNALGAEIK